MIKRKQNTVYFHFNLVFLLYFMLANIIPTCSDIKHFTICDSIILEGRNNHWILTAIIHGKKVGWTQIQLLEKLYGGNASKYKPALFWSKHPHQSSNGEECNKISGARSCSGNCKNPKPNHVLFCTQQLLRELYEAFQGQLYIRGFKFCVTGCF